MKLTKLLSGMIADNHIPEIEITALTDDSRKACPDSLFVCISGTAFDGHTYAPKAYENGCRVFVVQKHTKLPSDAFVYTVSNTREALAQLACRFYGDPSHKMRIFGITGTKGKTTTAQLIAHLLNTSDVPCGYIGTNGIEYLNRHIDTKNTTPDPLTLQSALGDMLRCGVTAAVLEVSSQALAQYRADGILFDTLIFTNLAHDHVGIGEHADFEDYKCAKKRLFTDFAAKNVVFWKDDPYAEEIVIPNQARRTIACSQQCNEAAYVLREVAPAQCDESFGVSFKLQTDRKTFSGYLPLLGKFNAQNAILAAAAVSEAFDISVEDALLRLQTVCVSGRSEQIVLPCGASVCIDYAHNAFSLQQLLTSLREYSPKRLLVLFGSVGERTQLRRREMGEIAARYADRAILTSDNPGTEPPENIIADIAKGFEGFDTPYVSIPDRKKAILYALGLLENGNILVLAGKGHERYQLIGAEKLPFCEKKIVEDYIASQNECATL